MTAATSSVCRVSGSSRYLAGHGSACTSFLGPVRWDHFFGESVIDLLRKARFYTFCFHMGERMILQGIFVRSCKNTVMQSLLLGKP
jgi:hypothetical protein